MAQKQLTVSITMKTPLRPLKIRVYGIGALPLLTRSDFDRLCPSPKLAIVEEEILVGSVYAYKINRDLGADVFFVIK